jgi:glucose-6-phosphate 1-epimerase
MLSNSAFCKKVLVDELACIDIKHPKFNAQLCLQGAQLTQFTSSDAGPLLWLSPDAQFNKGKSVRGGIPICWPWFGGVEFNPKEVKQHIPSNEGAHGFARNQIWELSYLKESAHEVSLGLTLTHNEHTLAIWPFEFELTCHLKLGNHINIQLECTNLSNQKMHFSQALHSYFPTTDINKTIIQGAHNSQYVDALDGWQHKTQTGSIKIQQEVDRLYLGHNHYRIINDDQQLSISSNSQSSIVWNPWIDKSKWLSHYPNNGYQSMVCIESANVLTDYVSVPAGETSKALTLEIKAG